MGLMTEEDMRRIRIVQRVHAFFANNEAKLRAWLLASNPLLGGVAPSDMWMDAQGLDKLEKFVEAQLAENPPAAYDMLATLRAAGWMVAVHNDYRQNGKLMTFWLFTRHMLAVKGEGETDAEALARVNEQISGRDR